MEHTRHRRISHSDIFAATMWSKKNKGGNSKDNIYLGREEDVDIRGIPMLIVSEDLAQQKIGLYIAGHLSDREGYDMSWLGKPVIPRSVRLRKTTMGMMFIMEEFVDAAINVDLNQLIYTVDKYQL